MIKNRIKKKKIKRRRKANHDEDEPNDSSFSIQKWTIDFSPNNAKKKIFFQSHLNDSFNFFSIGFRFAFRNARIHFHFSQPYRQNNKRQPSIIHWNRNRRSTHAYIIYRTAEIRSKIISKWYRRQKKKRIRIDKFTGDRTMHVTSSDIKLTNDFFASIYIFSIQLSMANENDDEHFEHIR